MVLKFITDLISTKVKLWLK